MVAVEVSQNKPLWGVELYFGDGLEMVGCAVVTLEEETVWSLLKSPRSEFFNLVNLCSDED